MAGKLLKLDKYQIWEYIPKHRLFHSCYQTDVQYRDHGHTSPEIFVGSYFETAETFDPDTPQKWRFLRHLC